MATTKSAAAKAPQSHTVVQPPDDEKKEPTAQTPESANGDGTADEAAKVLDILAPPAEKRWIIGKSPENGGDEETYSTYTQRPLGYIDSMVFFGKMGDIFSIAMAESGVASSMAQMQMPTIRNGQLNWGDISDATQFIQFALRVVARVPESMLDLYTMMLAVPQGEREWARAVMAQRWDPENDQWGLSFDMGEEIVDIFIQQNYEEIRRFFSERLGRLAETAKKMEAARAKKADKPSSGSVPSKQLKP